MALRTQNGTLPDSIRPFLLSSTLIGIDKNSGGSVRPIAIGEIFARIAAYRAQLYVQGAAKDILQPIQLGVAVPVLVKQLSIISNTHWNHLIIPLPLLQ